MAAAGARLSASDRATIAATMRDAPRGERAATAWRLAAFYGIGRSTIYRAAGLRGPRRRGPPNRPEYRDWMRVAVTRAHRAPAPMTLQSAIAAAIEAGDLPAAAADMPIATAQRVRREMGLAPAFRLPRLSRDANQRQHLRRAALDAASGDAAAAAGRLRNAARGTLGDVLSAIGAAAGCLTTLREARRRIHRAELQLGAAGELHARTATPPPPPAAGDQALLDGTRQLIERLARAANSPRDTSRKRHSHETS